MDRQLTLAEIRHKAQWHPGGVHPAPLERSPEICLELPWPPSINHYWRRHGQVIHVSTEGTEYARLTKLAVRTQFNAAPIDCRVAVLIEAWSPRRGVWDVDNREKPLLDALTRAEFWTDDKIVRDLRIVDRGVVRGGKVVVWVRPL